MSQYFPKFHQYFLSKMSSLSSFQNVIITFFPKCHQYIFSKMSQYFPKFHQYFLSKMSAVLFFFQNFTSTFFPKCQQYLLSKMSPVPSFQNVVKRMQRRFAFCNIINSLV
jgi:hypothetical protein